MEKKPTRAAQMSELYGDVLKKLNPTPKKPRVIKAIDTQTQEQKDKLQDNEDAKSWLASH